MTGIERYWKEQDEKRRAELTAQAAMLRQQLAVIESELFPMQWQWMANSQANLGMGLGGLFGGLGGGLAL